MRRVHVIAASAVLAGLIGVAVTQIDSGATSGPAAGEEAGAASDPGSEDATTTTTAATVPATGPGAPAPTTATPPPPVTSPTPAGQGQGPPIGPPPQPQVWSLPQGKLEVNDDFLNLVYNAFVEGCDVGRADLEDRWPGLPSPRDDFLFTAALHVCRGELAEGRRLFERGGELYGGVYANWGGVVSHPATCLTYKAVRSVLDNVPQGSLTCPGPAGLEGPQWPPGPHWEECKRPTVLDLKPCPDEPTTTSTTSTTSTTTAGGG